MSGLRVAPIPTVSRLPGLTERSSAASSSTWWWAEELSTTATDALCINRPHQRAAQKWQSCLEKRCTTAASQGRRAGSSRGSQRRGGVRGQRFLSGCVHIPKQLKTFVSPWTRLAHVDIHFRRAGPVKLLDGSEKPPANFAVVMVHGFGADSAYYSEQMLAVASAGGAGYAIDLLGQGKSWPSKDPAPEGPSVAEESSEESWGWGERMTDGFDEEVRFGEPAWIDHITAFIREVVPEQRVYLLGNSVGGYLSVKIAAREPCLRDRIVGLILANATPFWGWVSEGFGPWDGALPAPGWVRTLASLWYDALRSGIKPILSLVYATPEHPEVAGRLTDLTKQIVAAASHPMGKAAFASILLAPKQEPDFGSALDAIVNRQLPILLCYGEDDPWVVPFWAQRAAKRVENSQSEYYALSPAGHCVHHEVPGAFNRVMMNWLRRLELGEDVPALSVGDSTAVFDDVAGGHELSSDVGGTSEAAASEQLSSDCTDTRQIRVERRM
eukprot:TRINITY_DN9113_c0_g1_i5.p1 TRINITY_DN9113_c0_g1~~TRINITY_DN9113_c0_g1_i5.p1  ORF type:complete len:498 (-),score=64.39 TRINITY_DN9113_c0_g1_i5:257-1750(-)